MPRMTTKRRREPIRWVWVWRPDYYLEADGADREELEPGGTEWGTCHVDTEPGELVLLYRTTPRKDIARLLRTTSSARLNDEWTPSAAKSSWNYIADFDVLAKFDPPLSYAHLKSCRDLESWGALRKRFQGSFFGITPHQSDALWQLLEGRLPPGTFSAIQRPTRAAGELPRESEIEHALVKNQLRVLNQLYRLDLELWRSEDGRIVGKQLPCDTAGGRLDLLCRLRGGNALVVVEIKVGRADRETYGQISTYMGWVKTELHAGRAKPTVRGIVLSDGADAGFASALSAGAPIEQIDVRPVATALGLLAKR